MIFQSKAGFSGKSRNSYWWWFFYFKSGEIPIELTSRMIFAKTGHFQAKSRIWKFTAFTLGILSKGLRIEKVALDVIYSDIILYIYRLFVGTLKGSFKSAICYSIGDWYPKQGSLGRRRPRRPGSLKSLFPSLKSSDVLLIVHGHRG